MFEVTMVMNCGMPRHPVLLKSTLHVGIKNVVEKNYIRIGLAILANGYHWLGWG